MNKKITPLEALKEIENSLENTDNLNLFNVCNLKVIKTALKALEIIKNKVNLTEASNPNGTKQKCLVTVVLDNDKDFELLKEVLL